MDRKTYNRGVMDLLIGLICGVIMHFSIVAYLIVFGIAVVAMLIITAGGDASTYGNDEQNNFKGWIVLVRIITVSVGMVIGRLAMLMAF